jgi:ribonucleotide monophosphatase NagD (HAD superfamily)
MILSLCDKNPILICGKPYTEICKIEPNKKYIMVGDNKLTDGIFAENSKIHFFHKTNNNDLRILLSKIKIANRA